MTAREYEAVNVVVRVPHQETEFGVHDWWTNGDRTKLDRLGRRNASMTVGLGNATVWYCNDPACRAEADVRDDAVMALIAAAEAQL